MTAKNEAKTGFSWLIALVEENQKLRADADELRWKLHLSIAANLLCVFVLILSEAFTKT